MISTYDVLKAFRKAKSQGKDLPFVLSDDEKTLISKDGKVTATIEEFAQFMREREHCDFEVIYSEHVSLTTVYRCCECGTVIFGGDDDERYDPLLRCPTCGGYETHLTYWTKEAIENDTNKQESIALYEQLRKDQEEASKRYIARGGLYDWQLFKKDWQGKKHSVHVELQHFKTNKWYKADTWLKIDAGKRSADGVCYAMNKHYSIPLSPYAFYIQCVYPYTKKCHPDFKKYLPWQKHEV
jgi:DNA-directed RNA polymerase subunit RPC12/RpoP